MEDRACGRKVIALSRVEKNEQILFVPNSQLITLELARTTPLVERLLAARVPLRSPKHTQLAIFLLEQMELGRASPFHAYLETLPRDFSHFPLNYPPELLGELAGTCFLEQLEHKRADMRKDYQAVVGAEERFARFSFERFSEVRLLVSSRVFGIVVGQVKTDALVPVADMLNHRLPKQTSWYYCDRTGGFVIEALKEVPAGSEIFDSYGQKCNSRFLLNYGFVLPNNTHN
jgi:protein-histidine N-methyltransferase